MRRILLLAVCLLASVTVRGQIPGQNVNMVTGKTFPGGDPWLQKQNEPSGAVSTKNPCHLLAGANDYRAVNVPGLAADKETGDAWVGWYTSINCGQTWYSTLVPGYPQDTTAVGKSSPVYGLTTAADPTIRAGAGGFFAYSFIAFNRGTNVGKVAVARFLDRNTTEVVTRAENAISYIDTKAWDNGSAGNYIDKPYLAITQGTGTCTVTTASGKTAVIPASTIHLAWTVFVNNSTNLDVIRTKVYYARSSNCGASLDGPPTKLSEGYAVTQAASIAVASTGATYVVWRQFNTVKGDIDQLLVAKSIDGGKSFTKAAPVPMPLSFMPFDQGTTRKTFRTNAFATTAPDPWGRLYVAFSVRGYANAEQSRVVVMHTLDGVVWNGPFAIDNDPNAPGHQIMPAMTAVGGTLNVVWLDFHDDVSGKFNYGLFDRFIKEVYPVRHSMDVRGAQATLQQNGALTWTKYGILQDAVPHATVPRISKYLIGDYNDANGDRFFKQLQFNRSNLKLYAGGTLPFIGDFIDVAGLTYLAQQNGQTTTWLPNNGLDPLALTTAAQTFHAFWTDNRDAKVGTFPAEPDTDAEEGTTLPYMAPGTAACTGTNPPTKTRNANVYTARITPGLFVAAPTNSKPSIIRNDPTNRIVRAFPVFVQNNTAQVKTFRLTIVPPAQFPAAGIATFQPIPQNPIPSPLPAPVLSVEATVPAKSSITRTVSVVSTIKYPQIRVNVVELNNSVDPLTGSTVINADIENADIENADIENADIENQEIHNADIENADIENADIENADIENADIENADIENADIENADIENADIENADIENADIENADIENADIENGAVTDFSVDLDNNGNTSSSYQVKIAVGNATGYIFQLIGRRAYKTPSAHGCEQIEKTTNQILFNIPNPDISPGPLPAPTSPAAGTAANATILVAPRERLKLTLRVFDKDGVNNRQGGDGSIRPFCPIVDLDGANCSVVTNPVTVIVRAAATNTGSNVAFEEVVTTNPEGSVTVTTTTVPQATAGTIYSQQLEAVGGLGSYTWDHSGTLPPGLSLSPSGLLSGNATAVGVYNFVVTATDGIQSDTQALTLQVVASITTASVPGAIIGTLYGPRTLRQAGLSGPLTWTVQTGSLPAGVTLNSSTGILGGIATTPGVSSFVIQVQDAASNTATKAFSITAMTINAGDLIVADGDVGTTTGKLYRVTPFGSVSVIATAPGRPQSIGQDGNSFVVADRTNNSVLRVTPGNVETLFTWPGPGPAGFVAVAVTLGGDIIIGDNVADKVYKLSGGTFTTLGNLPASPGEAQNIAIAVEPDGGLMVVNDTFASPVQLVHFTAAGAQAATVTTTVANAAAIALHSSGDFLLGNYLAPPAPANEQIVRVTAAGAVVNTIPVANIGRPLTGLAIDFDEGMYAISGNIVVRHITTGGTFATITAGSPFVFMTDLIQFRPVSAFEFFVDGTPACASCAVTNEFAPLGTSFSFVTAIPNTGVTHVSLSGPNLFDHPTEGSNHTITAPVVPTGGWYNGTMTISTPGQPQTVTFRVQGNNSITTFPISAVDAQNNPLPIQRRNVFTYAAGGLTAREETIVITSGVGIAAITVDMPVGLLFVDQFVVTLPPVIIQ